MNDTKNVHPSVPASLGGESVGAQVEGSAPPALFPRAPGETPRAFSAFLAFFQSGHGRSLSAVAALLEENLDTVKRWSSRHGWAARIQAFNEGLLQQQAGAEAARRCRESADWARRTREFREQEWAAGQHLLAAACCFLESFGDRECEKMTLAQVSRAIQISAAISRQALRGSLAPEQPALSPVQVELTAALEKAYGLPPSVGSQHPSISNQP